MTFNLKKGGFEIVYLLKMPDNATMVEMQTAESMIENTINDAIEEKAEEILEACFGSRPIDSTDNKA